MAVNHPNWGTFCCICFKQLTPETCAVDTDGVKWDVCPGECAQQAGVHEPTDLPIVTVKRVVGRGIDTHWVISCPYCFEEHYHSPEPGERGSHCHLGNGYIVKLVNLT